VGQPSDAMNNDSLNTQIDNIALAADLLRRMFIEIQALEVDCSRLHFAMSSSGAAIRQRLDMLSGIAETLKSGFAPLRTNELCQRARRLIVRLAGELEQLSSETEDELGLDNLESLLN
jgi:hypothetical protein